MQNNANQNENRIFHENWQNDTKFCRKVWIAKKILNKEREFALGY